MKKRVPRPGGRTADVTARVNGAILDLLVESGIDACTFSAVAERAGVERSTLYRRFPDRWTAIADACAARAAAELVPELGSSLAEDLIAVLTRVAKLLETPLGAAILKLAVENPGRDSTRHFFDQRMEQLRPMFDAAVARGELAADVDREALFTQAAAPLYFQLFIAGGRLDGRYIAWSVSSACRLYGVPFAGPELSRAAGIA